MPFPSNSRPAEMVMFEGYFNLLQCFRKRLQRSLVNGDCMGPVTNNHPLVTKSSRLDMNFLGLCECDASRRGSTYPAQKQLVLCRRERNYHLASVCAFRDSVEADSRGAIQSRIRCD